MDIGLQSLYFMMEMALRVVWLTKHSLYSEASELELGQSCSNFELVFVQFPIPRAWNTVPKHALTAF